MSHFNPRQEGIVKISPLQRGVTSIEYALLASLIAIAIILSIGATGDTNGLSWKDWTDKVLAAIRK